MILFLKKNFRPFFLRNTLLINKSNELIDTTSQDEINSRFVLISCRSHNDPYFCHFPAPRQLPYDDTTSSAGES